MAHLQTRARIKWQSLTSRFSGLSVVGLGGISFKPGEDERKVVRDVLVALEDKRALYTKAAREEPAHVIVSIENIRELLTDGLKRVGDNSPARDPFARMRIECRQFMTLPSTNEFAKHVGMMNERRIDIWAQEEFFINLGKLRATLGYQIMWLGYFYQIDIEPDLAKILPPDAK